MSEMYDVAVVVGAGPGGSNAAAVLLRGGLQVVQLATVMFPRSKPCGVMTIKMTTTACNAL
jgi:flavin-dependent dehydrogenase